MLISFPGGQTVDVQFDETAHSYVVAHKLADNQFSGFRPTHGITAPLEVVPKPFLTPWGAKEGVHATLAYFRDNPRATEGLDEFFKDLKDFEDKTLDKNGKLVMSYYKFRKNWGWVSQLKGAYKEKSKEGKETGTWLHSAIENFYNSGRKDKPVITPLVEGMWKSFTAFDNYYKPKHDQLEFLVYSLMFGYSGLGDFRGTVGSKSVIADWKSTNRSDANPEGISVEYFFQLGGLAQAEYERTGSWVDDLMVVNIDKKGGDPIVLFASDCGFSPQDCARAYVSCFNTYHTIKEADYKYKKRDR